MASAADKVFATYELLENIILHLSMRDLYSIQTLNKATNAVADRSHNVSVAMYRRHIPETTEQNKAIEIAVSSRVSRFEILDRMDALGLSMNPYVHAILTGVGLVPLKGGYMWTPAGGRNGDETPATPRVVKRWITTHTLFDDVFNDSTGHALSRLVDGKGWAALSAMKLTQYAVPFKAISYNRGVEETNDCMGYRLFTSEIYLTSDRATVGNLVAAIKTELHIFDRTVAEWQAKGIKIC